MITDRSQYRYCSIDSGIVINGKILPQRDADGDGSSHVLRGEDMAFLKERMCEMTNETNTCFVSQGKAIKLYDVRDVFTWIQSLANCTNSKEEFDTASGSSYVNNPTYSGTTWGCNAFVNNSTMYFSNGRLNGSNVGDAFTRRYLATCQVVRGFSDAVTYPKPRLSPPASVIPYDDKLVLDDMRRAFYYTKPLFRQVYWNPNVLFSTDSFGAQCLKIDEETLEETERTPGSVVYASHSDTNIGFYTPGFSIYKTSGTPTWGYADGYHLVGVDSNLGRDDVPLPFVIKGYCTIAVFEGRHWQQNSQGENVLVSDSYGFFAVGNRSMYGTKAQRMHFFSSLTSSSLGAGILSKDGIKEIASRIFGFPQSVNDCQKGHSYDVSLCDYALICDRDLETEFDSISWPWTPS